MALLIAGQAQVAALRKSKRLAFGQSINPHGSGKRELHRGLLSIKTKAA
jgi:hypothetical protein